MTTKRTDNGRIADFLYEVGILNRTPRTGFNNLLSGRQNVAEHTHRVVHIALILASQFKNVRLESVMLMALFHDTSETRVSDLNYLHQKYVTRDETRAEHDLLQNLPFEPRISALLENYHLQNSREAKIVKDADNLELLLMLRENEQGNPQIQYWTDCAVKRLKTVQGRRLAQAIQKANPWDWWQNESDDNWWIHRKK